ncbi:MAG: methyltransferase domain-containing protein [Peptococcaceae bacterium]|nr:methyltransferase domain-containing protein [Peptococcaceae bacterium]
MIWDDLAYKYDRLWVQRYSLAPTRREILSRVRQRQVGRLLDVGCGTGQLIEAVTGEAVAGEAVSGEGGIGDAVSGEAVTGDALIACVGIDKSAEMIRVAEAKNPRARFYVRDICGGVPDALAGEKFDLIVCAHSFPYYTDKRAVLGYIAGLMAPGAAAIFVQASINNLYDKAVMHFVEKTAEKADYLSKEDFLRLVGERFVAEEQFDVKERRLMPSICGFVLRLRGKGE